MLNELDAMDRATLATKVLEGDETKFPARGNWEAQLFAAKNVFVAKGRDIMKKATQLQASAKDIQDVQNPNDPRAKELAARLQQLIQEATQAGQAFQAIIAQGKELASQTSAH